MCDVFIYSMVIGPEQGPGRGRSPAALLCWLVYFHNSGGFHYGGFLLPLCKFQGAVAINVHAGKFFAVAIVHGDLPMMMLAATVATHAAGLL